MRLPRQSELKAAPVVTKKNYPELLRERNLALDDNVCLEAADEIERLQGMMEWADDSHAKYNELRRENERLQADNQRLQGRCAALAALAYPGHEPSAKQLAGSAWDAEGPANQVIVGWMVGDSDEPAMYNLQEREKAFDAAKRWGKPIHELVLASAQKSTVEVCPRCQQTMPGGVALHTDYCPALRTSDE